VIAKTSILCRILWIVRLGRLWTVLIQNLHVTIGVSVLVYQRTVSNLTTPIILRTLANLFFWCPTICLPTNVWKKYLYSLLLWFWVLRNRRSKRIFLHPLMEELKELWQVVDAYESHLKCRFNLCVTYLWSIHDYLACGKFVGWCVHGWLNCTICMDDSDAFRLEHGRKVTFFDCHWRFLPSSHVFWGDKWSFLKGRTVKKWLPKWKLRADIVKMLDDLKELENGGFNGYDEKNN
jgi:hypothetical protein